MKTRTRKRRRAGAREDTGARGSARKLPSILEAAESIAGVDPLLGAVRATLDFSAIAEEEIEKGGDRPGLFALLVPREFAHFDRRLYRSHVRELIARTRTGERLDLGTEAEVLIGLSYASQHAPLTRQGTMIYVRVFKKIFPGAIEIEPPREHWEGEFEEALTDARRKVRTGRPRSLKGGS